MSDIEIEIDGKPLKAKPNAMIIQVADEAGIYIPRFCYHKHLTVAANCRMCLVEVEKAPKPAPACATPVMPGMKVFTRSPKALAAQRAVMEFLLINHPLDCPICDQGGECELQDLSMGYGPADSFYTFGKRSVQDENLGPLISSDMTRCIQCTRCVRFGTEIAGMRELGVTGRGEKSEIGTFVQHAIQSDISGNVIDLCPVGALTSKPFRFTARAWELDQRPSIAPHDCLGSNIYLHTRYKKVMRVVPRENEEINLTWISDRDRYSYQGIYHADRLAKPRIRKHGHWEETDWQTALEFAAHELQRVIEQQGAEQLGVLASPNSTTEEFYLLQKLTRLLGSENIDYRLRQTDVADDYALSSGIKLTELEQCDTIVLMGSNIQKEQPLASLRVRKAALKGAKVTAINMVDYEFPFAVTNKNMVAPHQFTRALAGIAKALGVAIDAEVSEQHKKIADSLRAGNKVTVIVGALACNHPEASSIKILASAIAKACNGQLAIFTEGANAQGAWLAGAVPQKGLHAADMFTKPRKAYLLLNVEPEFDCANPVAAQQALSQAECVVALSMYKNALLEQTAKVILPIAAFAETSGTFVNIEGKWQSFQGVATPYEEARPAWKVLRVLGNFLHLEQFEYQSTEEIIEEVRSYSQSKGHSSEGSLSLSGIDSHLRGNDKISLSRIGEIPIYAGDSLLRHAEALQATQSIVEGDMSAARMHPDTAAKHAIKEGTITVKQQDKQVQMQLICDKRIALDAVYIPGATEAAKELNELFGEVEIR